MNGKAAVNNTYESYEMLEQIKNLQEDQNIKCSRLKSNATYKVNCMKKIMCFLIHYTKVQQ